MLNDPAISSSVLLLGIEGVENGPAVLAGLAAARGGLFLDGLSAQVIFLVIAAYDEFQTPGPASEVVARAPAKRLKSRMTARGVAGSGSSA